MLFRSCFWTFAAPYYCLLEALTKDKDGEVLYQKWTGKDFMGKLIPFGARIEYRVPETRQDERPASWAPQATTGIFAGYEIDAGGHWNKLYKVWNITDFDDVDLHVDAYPSSVKVAHPNIVRTVEVIDDTWFFPLQAAYLRRNRTYEGLCRQPSEPEVQEGGIDEAGETPAVEPPPRPTGPDEYVLHKGRWCKPRSDGTLFPVDASGTFIRDRRSEEHTSELQSH